MEPVFAEEVKSNDLKSSVYHLVIYIARFFVPVDNLEARQWQKNKLRL